MDYGLLIAAGGVVVGFIAGRQYERDELARRRSAQRRDEQVMGLLGPYAAAVLTGATTVERAQGELDSYSWADSISSDAASRWRTMTEDERRDVGGRMLKAYEDPAFNARMDALRASAVETLDRIRRERAEQKSRASEP